MMARSRGVETKIIGGVERVVRIAYQRYSMDLETFMLEKRLNLDNRVTLSVPIPKTPRFW
jgi:hypothetical protein